MLLSVDKMWQDNDWVIDTMGGEKNSVFLELFRREGGLRPLELNITLGGRSRQRDKDEMRHLDLRLCTTSFTLLLTSTTGHMGGTSDFDPIGCHHPLSKKKKKSDGHHSQLANLTNGENDH